jgi:NitT/TauT family transport system substrate-binding protein
MTRASRNFSELRDVFRAPGTLAMEQGLPYSDFLKNKYGFGSLKIVPSPFGDLSVFRTDENYSMQCFVTSEPLAARRIGIEPKTFLIADSGYNPYATVLATTDGYFRANQSTVGAMVKAVAEGWDAYMKDPAPTNELMGRLNPTMDAQTFAESAGAQAPLIDTEDTRTIGRGGMTEVRWRTLASQLAELKVTPGQQDITECFIDPRRWQNRN